MCDHAVAITLASICFIVGAALPAAADPLAEKAVPSLSAMPSAEPAAIAGPTAAVAVRATPDIALPMPAEPAAAAETRAALGDPETVLPRTEPMARGERSRILSYILLQGLQGAGPYAGAR